MKIFVVDGNWYLHRVFYTQKFESANPALSISRRFVSLVCKDALAVKAKTVLVAFDGERVFRYQLDKQYKGNRVGKDEKGVYDHLGFLLEYLARCGLPAIQLSKYEGDDILCSVATQNENVVVGAGDKDGYQYLREGIVMYNSVIKPEPRLITHKDVERIFGVPPHLCLDYQTLVGDKGDNVPSLLGPKTAQKGLVEHGSLKKWLVADKKVRAQLRPDKDRLALNRKLVRLVPDLKVPIKAIKWSSDSELPKAYFEYKQFANAKTRSLF